MRSELTPRQLRQRIASSRVAFRQWSRELRRPRGDHEMARTIAEMEVNLLRELCEEAPAEEFDLMAALIDEWIALARS